MEARPAEATIQRFNDRADHYDRHRPSYPDAILEVLQEQTGYDSSFVVADLGSGTGILARKFLRRGNRVYCIEPNEEMRSHAERSFAGLPNFVSVNGKAEKTSLPDGSVDLVVAGQAFHWFNRVDTRQECRRILKPNASAALLWNTRRPDFSPLQREYEQLLHDYAIDYLKVDHRRVAEVHLGEFFRSYRKWRFPNPQIYDFDGFYGNLLSASYSPMPGHPNHDPMKLALQRIFQEHQSNGTIQLEMDTELFVGVL